MKKPTREELVALLKKVEVALLNDSKYNRWDLGPMPLLEDVTKMLNREQQQLDKRGSPGPAPAGRRQGAVGGVQGPVGGTHVNKHTPGPWVVQKYVVNARDEEVGSSAPGNLRERLRVVVDDSLMIITDMVAGGSADARLIAAAPDLLEACKASVARCKFDCTHESHCGRCEPLVRAIAKARGR